MKHLLAFLFFWLTMTGNTTAFAMKEEIAEIADVDASSLNENVIPIYGTACEKAKGDETKSTARVRVTDKASFLAVSSVLDVLEFRDNLNEHDYNVMVYKLVDESIEDMAVRTTKQNEDGICVEVTGYLNKDNISLAFDDATTKKTTDQNDNKESITQIVGKVNNAYSDQEIEGKYKPGIIPPTDDETLEQYKAPETVSKQPVDEPQVIEQVLQQMPEILPQKQVQAPQPPQPEKAKGTEKVVNDKRALVYVAPTEFFNNTQSEKHARILKHVFAKNEYFYVTEQKNLADYIIKSKVLRAKVDPINSSTNRLQMVVSVEVEFVDDKTSSTEHQNRFVLFSSDENEQKTAFNLMKKLFQKAGTSIRNKVEQAERKKGNGKMLPTIITPNNTKAVENNSLSI